MCDNLALSSLNYLIRASMDGTSTGSNIRSFQSLPVRVING